MDSFSPDAASSSNGSPRNPTMGLEQMVPDANSPGTVVSSSANSESRVPQPTVPAACLACRGKHLKCDGQNPCGRCKLSSSECIYVASRRGFKPKKKVALSNPNKRQASSSPPDSTGIGDSCPMLLGTGTSAGSITPSLASFNPSVVLPESNPNSPFAATPNLASLQLYRPLGNGHALGHPFAFGQSSTSSNSAIPAQVPVPTAADRCLNAFYHYFHAAHPFVAPKEILLRIAKDTNLKALLTAIRWIGSLFVDVGPLRATFFDDALRLAYDPNTPKDGFLLQTLLLLVIGLDGNCQQEKARQLLGDAERLAVQIAINTRPYATVHGRGIPVLEESWRRTWWDLYVVDGMIAGVHRHTNFVLFDLAADVALPCEEHQYLSGSIPQPMYLEDLEDRDFSGDDREFSSFAYRILAARNLGKFMRVPPILGPEDENLGRIENLLTNWRKHLPREKRDALNKNCQLDEMMFQGHMMTHATSILLHQPHSQLDSSATRSVTSCAPHRMVPSGHQFNSHTLHTMSSANEISKMITHRVPVLSHSHFFTCVVTLSSIVHLSRWALYFVPHDDDDLRQLIRLNSAALNEMSEVWKAANTAAGQVKGVAQEIYQTKKAQHENSAYWVGLTQEEVINSITADENIMSEIEGLQAMPNMLPG